jgi:LysM repeat protein
MNGRQKLKLAGLLALCAGAVSSPAAAGRCGGTYETYEATTLGKVALDCNVGLTQLQKANPNLDPGDIAPGTRLALPEEIDAPALPAPSSSSSDAKDQEAAAPSLKPGAYGEGGRIVDGAFSNFRVDPARAAHRIRVRDYRNAPTPVWIDRKDLGGGGYSSSERLSFQKRAARRIQEAGLADAFAQYVAAPPAQAYKAACVAKETETPEPSRIFNGFPSDEALARAGQVDALDCVSSDSAPIEITPSERLSSFHWGLPSAPAAPRYRLPDYGKIGLAPQAGVPGATASIALTGDIIDNYNGCLLLKTRGGGLWRLSAAPMAHDLMGKSVTVWGAPVVGGVCGDGPSMAVGRVVYGEPWPSE